MVMGGKWASLFYPIDIHPRGTSRKAVYNPRITFPPSTHAPSAYITSLDIDIEVGAGARISTIIVVAIDIAVDIGINIGIVTSFGIFIVVGIHIVFQSRLRLRLRRRSIRATGLCLGSHISCMPIIHLSVHIDTGGY